MGTDTKTTPAPINDEDLLPGANQRGGAGAGADPVPLPVVVGIGASAGGLTALKSLLAEVPEDSGVAYVLVVHLSPEHDSQMAELLQPHIRIPVHQVTETVALEANQVYIIPPGRNLSAIDSHLRLSPLEEQRSHRAPIDHFLRTLASSHQGNSVGIILTGTGSDGALGIQEIKGQGGLTVVQDPNEAEFDGMPRSALATGAVDLVLSLGDIIEQTLQFLRTQPRIPLDERGVEEAEPLLQKILHLVRSGEGRDFTHYKQSTIMRRIRRRMQLRHLEELQDYVRCLEKQPEEVTALAEDCLISVTSFFRDQGVFEKLEREVIPELFKRNDGNPIRVWSVGCATGEEAYSLAILLLEAAEHYKTPPMIQVFASDLHDKSLKRAREGLYPGDIDADVSEQRLQRFFHNDNGAYRIRKEVRDLVVFAPHNLLIDPPFSKVDLILCRNVLIYLQRNLQPDIVELFHYALNQQGWLVLGTAETVSNTDLFITENKSSGIYRKRNLPRPHARMPAFPFVRNRASGSSNQVQNTGEFISFGNLHHRMVERCAPPSLLVSAENNVVHLSDSVGRYLQQPGGVPSTNVFKLVHEALHMELRAGLDCARFRGEPYNSKPVPLTINGQERHVSVQTRVGPKDEGHDYVLLMFDECPVRSEAPAEISGQDYSGAAPAELLTELALTRRRLHSAIEEYEASQEEMRAANEELQSANEELRSTLEELETSKEELQSINEELQTANQENRNKVAELSQLSKDLEHLMAATHIATLFLDGELRILRFTPQVGDLFNLRAVDQGRPLSDLTHRLSYADLMEDARTVLNYGNSAEREVQDESGNWYLARIRPYGQATDSVNGVVLTFVDITARKASEQALQRSEGRYRALFESMDEGFCVVEEVSGGEYEPDFRVLETNPTFIAQTGLSSAEGRLLSQLAPQHLAFWADVYQSLGRTGRLGRFEPDQPIFDRWFEVYAFSLPHAQGPNMAILLKDIVQRKTAETKLREAAAHEAFRVTLADALRSSRDMVEIQALGCRLIAQHLGIDQVRYDSVAPAFDQVVPPYFEEVSVPEFMPWQQNPLLLEQLHSGQPLVMDDTHPLQTLTSKQRALCQDHGLRALISIPLLKGQKLMAVFSAYHSDTRCWSDQEIALVEECADRIWGAIERVRSEQLVRQREMALREADSRKDEFLAVLSHELRNPLASIMNSLHILAHASVGETQARSAQATIRRQIQLLARLVDDLLDLTRVARGKVQLVGERLSLDQLLERIIEDHRSLFEKSGVTLDLKNSPVPVWVHGDANRLAQAIGNLLLNCTKFTDRGGHTRVSLDVERERQRAVVRIEDSGAGMSREVLAGLFQPFVQGEATLDRSKGGLGLGLALSKRLIELHGGDIRADSAGPGKGSVFSIRLSMDESPPQEIAPAAQSLVIKPRKVLIIEDNIDAAKSLAEVLEFSDHQVAIAHDGPDGIELAKRFDPQVVLCDIGLPGVDGYQVAREFRADAKLRKIFLVALSGYAMPEDLERAKAAGFDRHLAKPPNLQALEILFAELGPSAEK